MEFKSDTPLLTFLQGDTKASSILVIESLQYLPSLRNRFPKAELSAVISDEEMIHRPEFEGLGVNWTVLDYRETVLPFPRKSFDIIISERMLENVMNPQDIASGIGTYIKDTGFLLTSFENIRYWRVLHELMEGHYYAIVHRRYAKPEFERLLYASFYKDIFFAPVKGTNDEDEIERLTAAGFGNHRNDLSVEVWMVQAMRSSADVSLLKGAYTAEERKRLAMLLRRIEYDIDAEANAESLWELVDEAGFSPDYLAAFAAEVIVHQSEFFKTLKAYSVGKNLSVAETMAEAVKGRS